MDVDREMMQRALYLAHMVEGRTSPRPSVGAVVVRDGIIVGEGATSPPYGPHAEVNALQEAGSAAQGANLYVSLEPCCVTIHTPPCTNAIIAAGIRRVVVATLDANPQVCGRGVEQLRAAGIEVVVGVCEEEAITILRPFATYITKKRPYITAKWAMTLDGKIATHTGDAFWISGEDARIWVHNLRDRVDAIMVGAGTLRTDNPRLTVRLQPQERQYRRIERREPLRVILSTDGQLPDHLHLLQPDMVKGTCVILSERCSTTQRQRLKSRGLDIVTVPCDDENHVDLQEALRVLGERGIMHVLLEGGAQMLGSAFDRGLIDHVAVFVAPKMIGGSNAFSPLLGRGITAMQDAQMLTRVIYRQVGSDLLIEGEVLPAPVLLPESNDPIVSPDLS